ncbi:hypothetical protein UNSWDHB_1811 [Dehalobacter sp. UNSWDHB]|nr:hypothetical protein UNSWDHB_1811 [Dehalobacter sp. UNSWDHB]
MYRVKGIRRNQIVRDGRGRFAKHVGDDSIKGYITNSEGILETVLFTTFTGNKFKAVAGVFPKNTNRFIGDQVMIVATRKVLCTSTPQQIG